ncbi:pentapeptide repeat-containing protein [Nocardia gipuzkoensis]
MRFLGGLVATFAASVQQAANAMAQTGTTTTPNPSWLTQPVATVIAGVLAVTTALIALAGVLLTRRSAERQFAQRQELDRSHFTQSHELERVEGMRKRYATCAEQLAHASPAVRQAGVYALAALADDWNTLPGEPRTPDSVGQHDLHEEARVCLDLLCAYLRASTGKEDKEVRQSIASVIQRHARQWSVYRYDLHGADLTHVLLYRAYLGDANLSGADLTHADLGGATLTHANLGGAKLVHANLHDANLNGAHLTSAHLGDANLSGVDLTSASLHDANLSGANLAYTNLLYVDLTHADLGGATLTHANLGAAKLVRANLHDANLSGADLGNADLGGADLSGAILRDAKLPRAKLCDVVYNDTTVWPDDFTPPSSVAIRTNPIPP